MPGTDGRFATILALVVCLLAGPPARGPLLFSSPFSGQIGQVAVSFSSRKDGPPPLLTISIRLSRAPVILRLRHVFLSRVTGLPFPTALLGAFYLSQVARQTHPHRRSRCRFPSAHFPNRYPTVTSGERNGTGEWAVWCPQMPGRSQNRHRFTRSVQNCTNPSLFRHAFLAVYLAYAAGAGQFHARSRSTPAGSRGGASGRPVWGLEWRGG